MTTNERNIQFPKNVKEYKNLKLNKGTPIGADITLQYNFVVNYKLSINKLYTKSI